MGRAHRKQRRLGRSRSAAHHHHRHRLTTTPDRTRDRGTEGGLRARRTHIRLTILIPRNNLTPLRIRILPLIPIHIHLHPHRIRLPPEDMDIHCRHRRARPSIRTTTRRCVRQRIRPSRSRSSMMGRSWTRRERRMTRRRLGRGRGLVLVPRRWGRGRGGTQWVLGMMCRWPVRVRIKLAWGRRIREGWVLTGLMCMRYDTKVD